MKKLLAIMKSIPTSKKLTYIFTTIYLLSFISAIVIKIMVKIDISNMITSILLPIQITVIAFYFGKSGLENLANIKNNTTQSEQLDNNQQ